MSKKILMNFGALATMMLVFAPAMQAFAYTMSPMQNGSLSLVGVTNSDAKVTAQVISKGSNANNVKAQLELRNASGQVVDRSITGTDILHENPTTFTLVAKPDLPAGAYGVSLVIYNSDNLVNAAFENVGTVQIGGSSASVPTVNLAIQPAPTTSSGNIKVDIIGIDPNSDVAKKIADLVAQSGLPAGTYIIKISTSDPIMSTSVSNNSVTLASQTYPMATSKVSNGGNPFAGKTFYIDPNNDAKHQADAWRSSRPVDAAQMDKIANTATARWFGDWNSNIESDVRNAVNVAGNSFPVFVIYNIPKRDCGGYSAGGSNNPDGYKNWINGFARGLSGKSAAVVVEPDALSLVDCLSATDKNTRFELVRYAVETLKGAGASVYIDAGHPNWISASDMASRLKQAGIDKADGFALNTSNFYSTSENINYGQQISSATGGKHFIIDTARNGNGPNGNEWCNPAGRALGTQSTANTGNALVDAFYWLKPPGQSDGNCNGGPNAGVWWADYALGLAQRAGF